MVPIVELVAHLTAELGTGVHIIWELCDHWVNCLNDWDKRCSLRRRGHRSCPLLVGAYFGPTNTRHVSTTILYRSYTICAPLAVNIQNT